VNQLGHSARRLDASDRWPLAAPPPMPAISEAERAGWGRSLAVLCTAGERIEAIVAGPTTSPS